MSAIMSKGGRVAGAVAVSVVFMTGIGGRGRRSDAARRGGVDEVGIVFGIALSLLMARLATGRETHETCPNWGATGVKSLIITLAGVLLGVCVAEE